ncbi:MAG: Glycosyl transferase family 2 [Candidatus Kaiserbacteria bacterium GW2011_GWA2_52_12]|uniref:Glycosyl transferase family 2 n=1 Tax=Candidatus Kaiserbacteria bacterium GW2011_GWA2_52_12 TaxID=1618671 RepID=A0A0G1ZA48_9BACT|nr:MAG: Glycosyl transferase family 2 [Candidatus Kaiserbacteria bacterium GW2011_GWA2_52_12]
MPTKFTLVIPTYNEAPIIGETLTEVVQVFQKHCQGPWTIVVADNASTDGTADIVRALNDPHTKVLCIKEKGRGRALRAAFAAAGEGIVAFTDADLPIEPINVLRGLEMIRNGECEIVVGTRVQSSRGSKRSFTRRLTSRAFQLLSRTIVGIHSSDSQCPLRVMNERVRPIMLATVDPTWWCELEFLVMAEKLNISIKELSVVWNEDRYPHRKSTIMVAHESLRAIRAMLKMRSYLKPIMVSLRKEL